MPVRNTNEQTAAALMDEAFELMGADHQVLGCLLFNAARRLLPNSCEETSCAVHSVVVALICDEERVVQKILDNDYHGFLPALYGMASEALQ